MPQIALAYSSWHCPIFLQWPCCRMTSAPLLPPHLFPTIHSLPSVAPGDLAMELNATACTAWEQTHHLLFHLGNLSLLLGLLIPTTLGLHMIVLRLLLMTGQYCVIPVCLFFTITVLTSTVPLKTAPWFYPILLWQHQDLDLLLSQDDP